MPMSAGAVIDSFVISFALINKKSKKQVPD
jgi:hypothetical protein